jgi:hypothetical protein
MLFSDFVDDLDLFGSNSSVGGDKIQFSFSIDNDNPYFYKTNEPQFYQNTDTDALMVKDFSFPLYNGNNEFFLCDCMRFFGCNNVKSVDYFVSGLYPEIKYNTASSDLKSKLDNVKQSFSKNLNESLSSLPFNLNNSCIPFSIFPCGCPVAVGGFSNLFLVNNAYFLHLSSFKVVVFYELWGVDFSFLKLNKVFLKRIFCPASLLDGANLDDDRQYKEAVLLSSIFNDVENYQRVNDILKYKNEDGVDFKTGLFHLINTF